MAGSDGGQHGRRLGAGLVRLGLGFGVIDHPGAGLDMGDPLFHEGGADDDAGVHLPCAVQVTHGAAVAAATLAFHHADKLAGAQLGGTGQGAHVHAGLVGVQGVKVGAKGAHHPGDQVHDVAVAIHFQQILDVAGAGGGDAGDVVAAQIHQHQVLGHLFLVLTQLQLDAAVQIQVDAAVRVEATAAGAGDGVHLHLAAVGAELDRALGGGAKQGEALVLHVEHVGAGVGLLEAAIGGDGIRAGEGEAAGRHHLEDVTTADEALELLDLGAELLVPLVDGQGAGQRRRALRRRQRLLTGLFEGLEASGQAGVARVQLLILFAAEQAGHQLGALLDVIDGDQGLGHIEAVVRAVVAPLWHLGQVFKGGDEVVGEAARHEEGLFALLALQLPLQGAQHVQHAAALEAAVFVKLPIGRREVEVQLVRHPGLGDDGGQALLQQAQQGGAVVAEGAHLHGAAAALDAQAGVHQQQALGAGLGVDLHRFEQQVVGSVLAESGIECQGVCHIGGIEPDGIEFAQGQTGLVACHNAFPCMCCVSPMVMALSLLKMGRVRVTSASSPSPCQCASLNCRFHHRSICRIIKKPAGVSGLFLWVLNLLSDYRYSNDHTPACQGVCHHQMVRMEVACMRLSPVKRCLQ